MLISYLQKTTLVDFPWKIACIVFTAWCNFRCPFCYNPESVIPSEIQKIKSDFISAKDFFSRLDKKKGLIDWVSICWWEPTLQPDLYDFICKIKQKGFLVKLDTNWRNASFTAKLLKQKLVDYIAIDVKYPLDELEKLVWVKINDDFIFNFKKNLELLKNSNIDYEYRTTVIKWYHTEKKISQICSFLWNIKNYFIQNYKVWKTLEPNFDWQSFTIQELQKFKKIALWFIDNVWIRE